MEYRLLNPDEVAQLGSVFESYGVSFPHPHLAIVAGAVDADGVVKGFHVCQYVPHVEPIWIHPDSRSTVDWRKMNAVLEEPWQDGGETYAFSDSDKVAGMLEKVGYEELPYKVWRKRHGE